MTGSEYAEDHGFGTSTNRTKFNSDGEMGMEGNAQMWNDITTSLIGNQLYSTAGTVDYDYTENCVVFQPSGGISDVNDLVVFNMQMPHDAKPTTNLNLHIHWEQIDSTAREFTVEYRVQSNGSAKTTAWTQAVVSTTANNQFTYTSGTLNQITELASIDMTGAGLSAVVQFQLTRSDSETGGINVTFIDAHYQIDTLGSSEEYTK